MRRRAFIAALIVTSCGLLASCGGDTSGTESITVYVTRTGSKYHRGNCQYLSQSKIAKSLEDARRSFDPCKVCKPPK